MWGRGSVRRKEGEEDRQKRRKEERKEEDNLIGREKLEEWLGLS